MKRDDVEFIMELKKGRKIFFWMIIASIFIVCGGLFIYSRVLINWYGRPADGASLGDSYGLANALFSALAFALLIVTAILQRRELELQRKQLKNNNKELTSMALAQELSQKALNAQVSLMAKMTLLKSHQKRYSTTQEILKENPASLKFRKNILEDQQRLWQKIIALEKDILKLSKLFEFPKGNEKISKN